MSGVRAYMAEPEKYSHPSLPKRAFLATVTHAIKRIPEGRKKGGKERRPII